MTWKPLLIPILLGSVVACASGPISGDYTVTQSLLSDDCGFMEPEEATADAVWNLQFNEDETVTFTSSESDDETTCTYKDSTVMCEVSEDIPMSESGIMMTDASSRLKMEDNGFTGEQDIEYSCKSGDCLLSQLPCSTSMESVGTLVE